MDQERGSGRVSPEDLADELRTIPGCVVDGESHGPATNSIDYCDRCLLAFYFAVARRVESATIERCAHYFAATQGHPGDGAARPAQVRGEGFLSGLPRLYPEGE